jgi:uncharacterized membrane protein
MKTYKSKYFLIAAVSLVLVIFSYFYDLPHNPLRSFFLGSLMFSLFVLFKKKKDVRKIFLYAVAGCILSFLLSTAPNVYDALRCGLIAAGTLSVYLITLTDKGNA